MHYFIFDKSAAETCIILVKTMLYHKQNAEIDLDASRIIILIVEEKFENEKWGNYFMKIHVRPLLNLQNH